MSEIREHFFSCFARDNKGVHVQDAFNKAAIEIDLEVVFCSPTRVAPREIAVFATHRQAKERERNYRLGSYEPQTRVYIALKGGNRRQ